MRELEDDIRCQTLQLIGLREEVGLTADGENLAGTDIGNDSEYNANQIPDGSFEENDDEEDDHYADNSDTNEQKNGSDMKLDNNHDDANENVKDGKGDVIGSMSNSQIKSLRENADREMHSSSTSSVKSKSRVSRLGMSASALIEVEERWKKEVERLSGLVRELMTNQENDKEELETLKSQIFDLKNLIKIREDELSTSKIDLAELQSKLDDAINSWPKKELAMSIDFQKSLKTSEMAFNDSIKIKKELIESLELKLAETKQKWKSEKQNLADEISNLNISINNLKDELTFAENKNGMLSTKVISLNEKIEDWQVICRLSMENLNLRHEALLKLSNVLSSMLKFGEPINVLHSPTRSPLINSSNNNSNDHKNDKIRSKDDINDDSLSIVNNSDSDNNNNHTIPAWFNLPPLYDKSSPLREAFDNISVTLSDNDPDSNVDTLRVAYMHVFNTGGDTDISEWTSRTVALLEELKVQIDCLRGIKILMIFS